ncbi:2-oxoacid:acceptor oxidoreductase family protein [Mycolicibacterium sp.]|uniref:2-oxoacid:acceptor oxidoreductase family protein n=1 Tax=Mycolicibacterium sp. TaxID=2320850 RepID=UPI0037CB3E87
MFEVRIHGRGGQGVVTAAGLLSVAAFLDGKYAQAFPSFGSERTGAPVAAFCRIDDKEIRLREPVTRPDALIVQDATLLHQVAVFDGVAPSGYLLINSMRTLTQLGLGDFVEQFRPERVLAVPATDLAREHLGRPVPNMVLLGAFAALTGQVSRDSMVAAIHERFTGTVADGNVAAVRSAFDYVRTEVGGLTDVAPN